MLKGSLIDSAEEFRYTQKQAQSEHNLCYITYSRVTSYFLFYPCLNGWNVYVNGQ